MSVAIPQFWQLLAESQLLDQASLARWQQNFAGMKGAAQMNSARTLAEWLIAEKVISRYQASVLLSGYAGPFQYGDYRVFERYESGRLAGRFRAFHAPTGHGVLLDFLSGAVAQNPQLWAAAAREAEQARLIAYPHISTFYDLVDLVSFKFAVLEDLQGSSLADALADGKRLAVPEACRIARFIALALAHLHQQGLVHGEVRPENIWLSADRNVKLLHVPLARPLLTAPGQVNIAGPDADARRQQVADYTAPELASGGARANRATDIYALGCTLYEMLAGRAPFAGGDAASKFARHASEPIAPLAPLGVPDGLTKIVSYMMAKSVAVRYPEAGSLADALGGFVDPSALNPVVAAASPSLGAFRSYVQQRRAALTHVARQGEPLPEINPQAASPKRVSVSAAAAVSNARGVAPGASLGQGQQAAPSGPRPVAVAGSPAVGGQAPAGAATSGAPQPGGSALAPYREKSGRRSNQAVLIGVGAAAIGLLAVVVIVAANSGRSSSPASTTPGSSSVAQSNSTSSTHVSTNTPPGKQPGARKQPGSTNGPGDSGQGEQPVYDREQTVPDNGTLLWASPTRGPPLELKYLPPGSQIYLAVRPAELFEGPEGEKILFALGPAGAAWVAWVEEVSGFKIHEIEQVLIGAQAAGPVLDCSLAVRLIAPADEAALLAAWKNPTPVEKEGQTYYTRGRWAYYVPAEGEQRVFAATSPANMPELIKLAPHTPPLRREMEEMLADTDAARQVTLLFAPNYLFSDGKDAIFAGPLANLRKPLGEFLGDENLKSALVSFHVDENFFAELRLGGTLDVPPRELAQQIHERLSEVPREIRRYFIALAPHPYTRDVLADFPEMVRIVGTMTRSDTEHGQAVLRAYLPAVAAHNLVMGCELTLAQQPGAYAGATAVAAKPNTEPPAPQSVAERLQRKTSLSFPRDTLEVSLQTLSKDIDIEIVILGGDLQLDGITKNQSFGIDLRDQPAKTILENILVLANPDKTVKVPSDPKQKLVYVIKPKEEGGPEVIFVTTRTQAEKRGDKLPPEFVVRPDAATKTGT